MEVAQLYASLKLDSAQYTSGIAAAKKGMTETGQAANEAQKNTAALAGVLGTVKGLAMAAFSFEAMRRGGMYLLQTASSMEQYRTRLRAVIETQKEADATFERIKTWAAINPVNTDEAIESFVLLKSAAVDNTEQAVKAVGNLAKVMGRDMRDVSMGLVGLNTMQLRRLGILLDQTGSKATIQIGKIRREVEKDVGSMRAALVDMIEQAYGRGMEMSKDTFQGIMDTISGQLQNFRVDLAGMEEGSPFRTITQQLKEMSEEFDKWMKSDDYKEFVKNFQKISIALIEGAEAAAKFGAEIVTSDIGSEIIKWGVGLKVVSWGFNGLLSLVVKLSKGVIALQGKIPGLAKAINAIGPASGSVVVGAGALAAGYGLAAWSLKDAGKLNLSIEKMAQKKREDFAEGEEEFLTNLKKELAPYVEGTFEEIGKNYDKALDEYRKRIDEGIEETRKEEERILAEQRERRPVTEKILDPLNEALRLAQPEFEKARGMISAFGLDSETVMNETAEVAKEKMEDILKSVKETYGPAGIMAMADKMREFDKIVPAMAKVAIAIQGIKNEAKSAKDQLSDMNNELNGLTGPLGKVMKALGKGLFKPEDMKELASYIETNLSTVMDKITQVTKLEFPGLSPKLRGRMETLMSGELMESFGFKKVTSPQGTIGAPQGKVEVDLSPQALKGLSDAQSKKDGVPVNVTINQYGFNVKSETEARRMGRVSAEGVRLGLMGAQ